MIGRRGMMLGAAALLAGGMTLGLHVLTRRRYPPGPYDDVLNRLGSREAMAAFGALALKTAPGFAPDTAAARLRTLLGNDNLETAALRDAGEGRVVEAANWLAPESVALMAMLAARAAPRE